MDDGISVNFDTAAMEKALIALPGKVSKRIVTEALQAAGDVILSAMVAGAPERTDVPTPEGNSLPPGFLKADLHTQIQIKDGLAPRVKVGSSKYTAHVSHWIEDGWTLTSHGKKHTGHAIRHIPGAHFMASASDETRDSASQALLDGLSAGLSNSLGNGEEI